jgi:hypothetical protein
MLAALLLMAPAAGAAEPTLSDIAGCNEQAAQKTGASALPAPPGARGPEVARRAPDDSRQPRELPAMPGEKTDPTGAIITRSPDPLLKGMDAGKADDPAYRAAYRECMRARQAR